MGPTGMQSYLRASVRSGAALLGYSCPHRTIAACRCAGERTQLTPCWGDSRPHSTVWQSTGAQGSLFDLAPQLLHRSQGELLRQLLKGMLKEPPRVASSTRVG